MRLLLKYLLFILLPAYTYGQSGRPDAGITFEVTDSLHNPLAYATVDSIMMGCRTNATHYYW